MSENTDPNLEPTAVAPETAGDDESGDAPDDTADVDVAGNPQAEAELDEMPGGGTAGLSEG